MKRPFDNKVIVIGADHHTTLGAIRSLGEQKVDVYAILQKNILDFTGSSKYIKGKTWYIKESSEVLDVLLENFPVEKNKTIILTCSDEIEYFIDSHFSELADRYLLPFAAGNYGPIHSLMDKDYMSQVAKQIGVLSPFTWTITKECLDTDIQNITFPCLCKPLKSASGAPVGGTYIICDTRNELEKTADKYFASGFDAFVCEQYIDSKTEISVEGCSFGDNSDPFIPLIQLKVKAFKANNGSTTSCKLTNDFSIYKDMQKTIQLLKEIRYSGVFDLEFRILPEGSYLLDANLRVGGCSYGMTRAHANIIYEWCYYTATGRHPKPVTVKKDVYFINEFFYIHDIKRRLCCFTDLFLDLFKRKAFAVMNIRDPKPFIKRLFSRCKR